jgi:hypothetical protein
MSSFQINEKDVKIEEKTDNSKDSHAVKKNIVSSYGYLNFSANRQSDFDTVGRNVGVDRDGRNSGYIKGGRKVGFIKGGRNSDFDKTDSIEEFSEYIENRRRYSYVLIKDVENNNIYNFVNDKYGFYIRGSKMSSKSISFSLEISNVIPDDVIDGYEKELRFYIIPIDDFQNVLRQYNNELQTERKILDKLKEKSFYNNCTIRFG